MDQINYFILKTSPHAIVLNRLNDGSFVEINDAFIKLTGYEQEEIIGKKIKDINIWESLNDLNYIINNIKKNGCVSNYQSCFKNKNGEILYGVINSNLIKYNGQNIILSIINDITSINKSEIKLKEKEGKYKIQVECQGEGIAIVDIKGNFLCVNPATENIFNLEKEVLIGKNIQEFIATSQFNKTNIHKNLTIRGKSSRELTLKINNKDKKILLSTSQLFKDKNPPYVLAIFKDISEQEKTFLKIKTLNIDLLKIQEELIVVNEELEKKNKTIIKLINKAEEANNLKSFFLANLTHEIRTPLNGIIGFLHLLLSRNNTKEKRDEFSQIIMQCSESLIECVENTLYVSKIESSGLSITRNSVSIMFLFQEIHDLLKKRISSNIEFTFYIKDFEAGKDIVFTDTQKIKKVLIHLIDNSIKFTNKGRIEFSCEKQKDNILLFKVCDTGSGIPDNSRDFIFDKFRQVNESLTRTYGGLGLGLTISKAIVDFLGGKIWFESKVNIGTTFYFTIPY